MEHHKRINTRITRSLDEFTKSTDNLSVKWNINSAANDITSTFNFGYLTLSIRAVKININTKQEMVKDSKELNLHER